MIKKHLRNQTIQLNTKGRGQVIRRNPPINANLNSHLYQ